VLGNRWLERMVMEPSDVAAAIVRAVERDQAEVFVPRWYRLPALVQALAPSALGRLMASRGYRRQVK
jgi:short-subunit dehydrogenase